MNKQDIIKAIVDFQEYIADGEYNGNLPPIYLNTANLAIVALEQQLNNEWIPVSERLPKYNEFCWVWFNYGDNTGFCEKMFLSKNEKWMKNNLCEVKDDYAECIKAWQPYYEPEPYKEGE